MEAIELKGNTACSLERTYFFQGRVFVVKDCPCEIDVVTLVSDYLGIQDNWIFREMLYISSTFKFIKKELKKFEVKKISKMTHAELIDNLKEVYARL